MKSEVLPRFLTCKLCGNEYHRLKSCWYCIQEPQRVHAIPQLRLGSEPWGPFTIEAERRRKLDGNQVEQPLMQMGDEPWPQLKIHRQRNRDTLAE